ncbi:ATP-dependent helicase [Chondrinema litorale]|uniref:ATP-dependent helicase n=1 Tax=Chondrinema litorale TaxID=2994555 RepID=UPI00254306B2|nr:ATP-dependent helicase [Chondrinema litorale]UZS00091.1 ATP-dependent helicase [Chondrinema litorale]
MLEVRRGIAAKSYENSFFREFAKNLSQMFEKYNMDGLLVGNSECTVENWLQIDALLITQNVVCIIDFKNFGGEITLPRTSDFLYGRWTDSNGEMVKGGSSINPYCQLKTQRKRFYDVFKSSIESKLPKDNYFNPGHTVRIVCFQKEIHLNGGIPPEDEVNFKIIHNGNYLEKIKDIIDVNDKEVNLKRDSFQSFLDVFEADTFDLEESYGKTFEYINKSSELNFEGLRIDQKSALSEFCSFLKEDEERVFVLQGTSNSGKTHLIPFLKDLSFENGISQVEILAPSSRIANNLVSKIDDIGSLYSYIYGGNQISEHEEGEDDKEQDDNVQNRIDIVPLKKSDNEENALFIIDESQLISDSYHQSMDLRFGSGYLLKDFIKFLNVSESKRKVVFIGDCYQISLGKPNENPLSTTYLNEKYDLPVRAFQLDDNPDRNIILDNALSCVSGLRQNLFNRLEFSFFKSFYHTEKEEVKSIIKQYFDNSLDVKFLTYTNEESQKVNLWIKKVILQNSEDLSIGDLLLLNNNISVEAVDSPFSKPQKVYNGQFFICESSGDTSIEKVELKSSKTVELKLRELTVKLLGKGATVEFLALENYRNNPKGELSEDETIAIKILLNRELKILQEKNPFEKSSLFQNLINSEEYKSKELEISDLKKLFDSGEKVKTRLEAAERQLRVLTNKIKRKYRVELERELMKNPSSKYYKIKNLALLRFGWAMNVHKAMSYKWDNVIFNVDWNGGIANASYFKWLYTGVTRAKEKIHLLNYEGISPTLKTEFKDIAIDSATKKDYYVIIDKNKQLTDSDNEILNRIHMNDSDNRELVVGLYKTVENKLYSSDLTIKAIEHPNYQQVYTLSDGTNDVKIRFYYDGKLRVKAPTIQSGKNQEFNKLVLDILVKNRKLNDFSIIKDSWRREFYELLERQFNTKGLFIQSIIQNPYKDFVSVSSENDESIDFDVTYNGDGFFTSILARQYSDENLWVQLMEFVKKSNHGE